ncbi:MAG: DUF5939 domain-containing protein [Myxococcota bacterium]
MSSSPVRWEPSYTVPPGAEARSSGTPGPMQLPEFLQKYPWPEEWLKLRKPLDNLWCFELDATPQELWPHLADTSTFNHRLGTNPMVFTERDGRVFGRATNAGTRMVWEEIPWEWEYAKGLNNTRIYREGFLHVGRARYLLSEIGPRRTRFYAYFGWIPRGVGGAIKARLGAVYIRRQFARVLKEIVTSLQQVQLPVELPLPVSDLEPGAMMRLVNIRHALDRAGVAPQVRDRLFQLVEQAPDLDVHRIRVRKLVRAWNIPERTLLGAFLHATRHGLFTLTWDVLCPHCRGVRTELAHLGDVPPKGTCDICGIDFDVTAVNSLEVTFHIHPTIRHVTPQLYCSAEPARRAHIVVQKTLPPGMATEMNTLMDEGRYRIRLRGSLQFGLLDVLPGAEQTSFTWSSEELPPQVTSVRLHPTLTLKNPTAAPVTFTVERDSLDTDALRPVDLFCFQDFRDLFSEEAVAADMQLDIGTRTVLFTDLVGSTRLYEEEGDTVAFASVRRHFIKAYETVRQHDGAIIKTIGDAVMAVFARPADAVRTALDLQSYFNGSNPETNLRLRISLHTGPCLGVRLNQNMDLFGSTVNLAAKMQAAADAGHVVFTRVVREDLGVEQVLAQGGHTAESLDFELKWSGARMELFRVTVK